ncbi:MAG: tRNA uridine-5-carboxymethylaminomethyl(34) synthesis GTPase MnmE [Bacteroidota bacterium]
MTALADTIVALSTSPGVGAIAVIRLSGEDAISITNKVFKGKNLEEQASHTVHFGTIQDNERVVDEVLVTLFKAPTSFTKENVVEISCHGSPYIVKEVIKVLIANGARLAKAGEFTQRAFLNGQFDLAQAEAVADLINSDSAASHEAAMNQMRGGFSEQIKTLRQELIHFASMIELELDFGEEDVEFADRDDLKSLIHNLLKAINVLIESFDLGNVIKNGVPTVIAGKPNAGKSTLLNALLNEERAIVSDIAGTTRDVIEDEMTIDGINFRFIDTAGLRETTNTIEAIGVERTQEKMKAAALIIYMFDLSAEPLTEILREVNRLENNGKPFICVGNKIDKADREIVDKLTSNEYFVLISASQKAKIDDLKSKILEMVNLDGFKSGDTVVTNIRHYDNLLKTRNALQDVLKGLGNNVTGDFLAMDIRQSLHYLGEITGEITTDDLLANIFSKFCIGK